LSAILDMPAKARNAAGMPSDPPNDAKAAPAEALAPQEEPAEAVAAAASVVAEAAEPAALAPPAVPPEPVSKVKEWAVAVAIMIVFAMICAQFVTFLRSNQYGGP